MRHIDMIKAKVEAETEAIGYLLAAVIAAKPATPDELEMLLNKVRLKVKARYSSGVMDHQVFHAAFSMVRGIQAFKEDQEGEFPQE